MAAELRTERGRAREANRPMSGLRGRIVEMPGRPCRGGGGRTEKSLRSGWKREKEEKERRSYFILFCAVASAGDSDPDGTAIPSSAAKPRRSTRPGRACHGAIEWRVSSAMPPPCAVAALALLYQSLSTVRVQINASVTDGVLTTASAPPCALGNSTSALSSAIDAIFGALVPASSLPLKNSTSFYSYMTLSGDYVADAPVLLPRGVALSFVRATVTVAPAFPAAQALFNATGAPYSAVVAPGGPSTASILCPAGGPSPVAVLAASSDGFVLDGVRITGCGADGAAVHVRGAPYITGAEIANCEIFDSRARAVWTEACARVVVHGNVVNNTAVHSIDMDAYSSFVTVYNNTVSHSIQEAVFIEQGASNVVVVDNTLGPGNTDSVAVYNNAFKMVTSGHVIVRNRIFACSRVGISTGSGPHHTSAEATGIVIAGNMLWDNNGTGIRTNGDQTGTAYYGNDDADGMSAAALGVASANNISFADPSDRVAVASSGVSEQS